MASMQELIQNFPSQLSKAIEIGKNQRFTTPQNALHNIVIAGLGGSGIGGSMVESMVIGQIGLPIVVCKNYEIPAFVGKNTLFIACSFSGGTEETLMALSQVKEAKIACITSGGQLLSLAKENGYDYVQIPNEAPCPRAFLGYSLVQLLYLLKNYQLINNSFEAQLEASIEVLQTKQAHIHEQAKQIAENFHKVFPIIYADTRLGATITRLQQQINENAKQLCHTHLMPEMNHNELVGWELDAKNYENIAVLLVKTASDHPRTCLRMDICEKIFVKKAKKVFAVEAQGNSFVEQCLYLIHIFDWASWYLAALNGVDPFPVEIISHLKNELAKVPANA